MKSIFKKISVLAGLALCISGAAQAQAQKMGDNLGSHKAIKDLDMGNLNIVNAKGISIGIATVSADNIALQIGSGKAILVTNVVNNSEIVDPINGMIIFNTTDQKFYVRQSSDWVTFALALKASTNGIDPTANANGYVLTQEGVETVLRLTPADATHPGVVTVTDQEFAGNKVFGGNLQVNGATLRVAGDSYLGGSLDVGTVVTPASTTLNGDLLVTRKTELNGNIGTAQAPISGLTITNTVPALNTPEESLLVVDGATGEVRRSSMVANAVLKQKIAAPPFALGRNEAIKLVLTVPNVSLNDGIVVNFDGSELLATPGLEFISILNATATGTDQVTVTIADERQESETGTPALIDAATLLAGKSFIVTRYK